MFFYLLASDYTDEDEVCKSQFSWLKEMLSLTKASDYHYLNQASYFVVILVFSLACHNGSSFL